jgi:hypothetical protein
VHGAASPLVPVAGREMGVVAAHRPADYLLQRAAQERVEEIGPPELSRIARRHFGLNLSLAPPDVQERFTYGREPGGAPSRSWDWSTLP